MRIASLVNRFQFYAENHKSIRHVPGAKLKAFLHIEIQDLVKAAQSGLKFPALLLQTPEVEKSGAYDNMGEDWSFTYVLFMKLGYRTKAELIDELKSLADDTINMLMLDVSTGIFPSMVPGSNEGIVGPLVDDVYGWGVSVSLNEAYDAEVDPTKWLHLTPDPEEQI